MTTATAPPLLDPPAIDVSELPALDQPDERVCELIGHSDRACREPAVWALTFGDICGCYDNRRTLLLACDSCRRQVELDVQAAQCLECLRYLPLLRAEPL